jgi:hypothetical protein
MDFHRISDEINKLFKVGQMGHELSNLSAITILNCSLRGKWEEFPRQFEGLAGRTSEQKREL